MAKKLLVLFLILITVTTSLPLLSGAANGADVTIDDIIKTASDIIRENEGTYASVNPNDNGALSIGWIQWHATRALELLKDIVAANKTNAKSILGNKLYNEIMTAEKWSTRILTKAEAEKISALISTPEGKAEQDKLAAKDISTYINRAIGYGIKDPSALVYYADIENQCGAGGAKPTAEAAKKLAGSYAKVKLSHIYKASLADSIAGKYATRRQKTYNNCLLVNWSIIDTDLEVWDILSARNVRSTPDTASTLVTSIAKGTKVVISEKAAFGSQTRGKTSMGWITLDSGSCALNEKLSGGIVPAPIIFDTNGGTFNAKALASTTAQRHNESRTANALAVYTSDYTKSNTPTNTYGSECRVDANGLVLNTPAYGTNKSAIPKGGMVLSGNGAAHQWLIANVKKGYYVSFSKESMTVSVYKTRNEMLALSKASVKGSTLGVLPTPTRSGYNLISWIDSTGKAVTEKTVCSSPFCITLKASWKKIEYHKINFNTDGGILNGVFNKKIDGVNVSRGADKLILYRDKTTSGTNAYGKEAIVTKNGIVTSVYSGGNSDIPSGGFVISGHGTSGQWIIENLSVGNKIVFNEESSTVSVYKDAATYNTINKTIKERTAVGTLPTATKEYHKFLGWYNSAGTKITSTSLMPDGGMSVTAKWQILPGKLTFDVNGGTIKAKKSTFTLAGTNIFRAKDLLVVYKDKDSSGTNIHGTEVLVGADGIVDIIYPAGTGNNKIPEGCYILSGNGKASTWLKNNVSKGNYVTVQGTTVTVWESKNEYSASLNTSVTKGKAYGTLPSPTRTGYYFAGWVAPDGKAVTSTTKASQFGDVTLKAKWEKLLIVTFDANGGKISSTGVTVKAKGINVQRTADTLVIYTGAKSTGTNAHGTDAVIASDGTVTAVKKSGNTAIPDGYTILSGNGTMSTWIKNNISKGSYVVISGYNVTVYKSISHYDATDGKMSVRKGTVIGATAKAALKDHTLAGWFVDTKEYTDQTAINTDIKLLAKWAKSKGNAVFDMQGGTVYGPVGTYKLDGVNTHRKADSLILYNSSYSSSSTTTNSYGSEAAVGSNGTVSTTPVYGSCKTAIPKGGYVLSGNGKGHSWLKANVKAGYYIHYNKSAEKVTSYRTYGDFLADKGKVLEYGKTYGILPTPVKQGYLFAGWKNSDGVIVTSTTKVPDCSDTTLTAVWKKLHSVDIDLDGGQLNSAETALLGINTQRLSDTIVLFKNKASTGTNKYGTEALIDSTGKVVTIYPYGKGNNIIPSGHYILSGNGTMSQWIQGSLAVGKYVTVSDNTIKVYDTTEALNYSKGGIKIANGDVLGKLPSPYKFGYTFNGWYTNGVMVTDTTKITADTVLKASWQGVSVGIIFNSDGGSIPAAVKYTVKGINVHRATNSVVIFDGADGKTSTGTNTYGTETIVDNTGKVIEIRPHGKGNASIPEGGYVISGNGDGSAWIKSSIKVGSYIVKKDLNLTVYDDIGHYYGIAGKSLYVDKTFGALPTPKKQGYTFIGWYTPEGKKATANTKVPPSEGKLTLTAKWEKNS